MIVRDRAYQTKTERQGRTILAVVLATAVAFAYTAAPACAASEITKEETVYVVTDSTGAEEEIIVSDHLKNDMEADTIDDATNLKEIENVKGEETFDKGKGEQIIWKAKGNDIFYEGVSNDETPVTMDITYKLDGAKVEGSELKDKKGVVEIEIDFRNNAKARVDGKEVNVPFIAMTGFIASDDTFSDIEIDHGKVIDDGDKKIVVGMAAPGLADALDIDLDKYDIDLSDSIRITGKASKFDVQDIMTVVTNSVFEDIDTDDMNIDFDDEVKALNDGATALVEGSDKLYTGIHTLYASTPGLENGVGKLKKGADKLKAGTDSALDGSKRLKSGIGTFGSELRSSMSDLIDGTDRMKTGSETILGGLKQIKTGLDGDDTASNPGVIPSLNSVETGLGSAATGIDSANNALTASKSGAADVADFLSDLESAYNSLSNEDKEKLKTKIDPSLISRLSTVATEAGTVSGTLDAVAGDSLSQISDGVEDAQSAVDRIGGSLSTMSSSLGSYESSKGEDQTSLIGGMTVIDSGLKKMNQSLTKTMSKTGDLNKGLNSLTMGSSDLVAGEKSLASGAKGLADGLGQLDDSTAILADGVSRLNEGSLSLRDGMSKFYTDGIKQLVDLYENDIKGSVDNLRDTIDAGADYRTFTRLPSGMDGNVKFIYKTSIY